MSREVVIVAYGRSAVCKSRKGSFAGTHPIEYSAQVLKGVLDKVPQLDRSEIEDVIMGCAVQHGTTSMNIAKSVCARAELPECVAGHTITVSVLQVFRLSQQVPMQSLAVRVMLS